MADYRSPLITVYITNYNYGKFLKKSVESVLNQTEQDFELIIIDDGSTDNSKQVLEQYETKPHIEVVYQNNKGLTASNNIALRLSKGKYIIRLDADDYLDVNALQILSGVMEKNPKIGMVFGDWYLIDENDNIIGIERRHDFSKDVSLYDSPAHGACTLFRTESLKQLNGYDESISRQDGYELWLRFIEKYEVKNINIPIFYYRQHSKSLTKDEKKLLDTRAQILEKHAKRSTSERPSCMAIVPIRGSEMDNRSQPFLKLGNKYLIDYTVNLLNDNKEIDHIIITTPAKDIIKYIKDKYKTNKIETIDRPRAMARINTRLDTTINHALENMKEKRFYDYLFFVTIDTPFKRNELINSAINFMKIFDVNTVIGARPDRNIIFKHDGSGLIPLNKSSNLLRLEREQLYNMVPGFVLRKTKDFLKEFNILGNKIGHVVFDQKSSISIKTELDFEIANNLVNK
jgi:CMP-N-acetylneuraminic acid synthetase